MDNSILSKITSTLQENINKCFSWKLTTINNRAILSLLNWSIEITVPMVDAAYRKVGRAKQKNESSMLRECITELLQTNFEIKYTDIDRCVDVSSDASSINVQVNPLLQQWFSICRSDLASLPNPIVVVSDSPRTGKTLLIKWYLSVCRKKAPNKTKIWWLDFNGGYTDIRDFLVSFFAHPLQESNYIVLDNIECCGFIDSQRILRFFITFINRLNALSNQRLNLYIIQDNTMAIFPDYTHFKNVIVYESSLLEKYQKAGCNTYFADISFKKISSDIDVFLSNNPDKQTLSLFAQLVIFSKYGVSISSKDKARFLKCITGIRVTKTGEIISFSREISEKILSKYSDRFANSIGQSLLTSYSSDFLSCYYKYLDSEEKPIAISSIKQILENTDCDSSGNNTLKKVLARSEQLAYNLADLINEPGNTSPFANHLGATLFAAEAMASYSSSNWKTLHAWSKLRNHILEYYYVDSQEERLPEIAQSYKHLEGTYKDFVGTIPKDQNNPNITENCILSQVILQDELINSTTTSGKFVINQSEVKILMDSDGYIDDHLFDLFLSSVQIDKQPLDIDCFFRTYLLALLFEFEVTAPTELRNQDRIDILLKKIMYNVRSIDDSNSYFYPKRIAWVSARMLLALCHYRNHFKGAPTLSREIETIIRSLANYLISCSITYTQDNITYRFWGAGAGLWNSSLETSIMCTFAVREAASYVFAKEIEEGRRFILHYSERWFENKLFADGLWAYRILHLDILANDNFSELLQDFFDKTNDTSFPISSLDAKNDKSLGYSHIVKTYLELAYDFVNCRPTFEAILGTTTPKTRNYASEELSTNKTGGQPNMPKYNTVPKYKIAITFTGAYRESHVRPICEQLIGLGYEKNDIFFDEWHDDLINGPHGNAVLRQVYTECDCDVVLLSPDYKEKPWTYNIEWPAILERIISGNGGKICLLSVDGLNIDGIEGLYNHQAIAKNIDNIPPKEIAEFINRKYTRIINEIH